MLEFSSTVLPAPSLFHIKQLIVHCHSHQSSYRQYERQRLEKRNTWFIFYS